jgi:hypothetical protein
MENPKGNIRWAMGKLKVEFPSFGWKQILTARKDILDAFDSAREMARTRRVETLHGEVAEGAVRQWLAEFLPKRYGVASGYVVSPGFSDEHRAPHFDVIIYDQLESPVLWVEDSPDRSPQGRSLALPVEYVRAVLEVKSQMTAQTMRDAVHHLGELTRVMEGADAPNDPYKLYLPPAFFCGVVFMELMTEHAGTEKTLSAILEGIPARGFIGGVVLRCEGHTLPDTGRISLVSHESPFEGFATGTSLIGLGMTASTESAPGIHIGAMLQWSGSGFAAFAFDLVALLQGTFRAGYISSFYGMGTT